MLSKVPAGHTPLLTQAGNFGGACPPVPTHLAQCLGLRVTCSPPDTLPTFPSVSYGPELPSWETEKHSNAAWQPRTECSLLVVN